MQKEKKRQEGEIRWLMCRHVCWILTRLILMNIMIGLGLEIHLVNYVGVH